MIELARASALLAAPVSTVFQYVTNMENYGLWFPGVQSITSKNSLPHTAVGKTYIETLAFPDGEYELTIEVVKCELNRLFLTQGDLDGVLPQMTIEFTSVDDNKCRMNLKYDCRDPQLSEESDLVVSLRKDLAERASLGMRKLRKILERKRCCGD